MENTEIVPTIKKIERPSELPCDDLTPETCRAVRTYKRVLGFAGEMADKMIAFQGTFDPHWIETNFSEFPQYLELEMQRHILDKDYISLANTAMMAYYEGQKTRIATPPTIK